MLPGKSASLSSLLREVSDASSQLVVNARARVSWGELAAWSYLGNRLAGLRGCSVVLAISDQVTAVAAMLRLDGLARRMVLFPPDMAREHLLFVAECAGADALVSDGTGLGLAVDVEYLGGAGPSGLDEPGKPIETEWILLTSGTTGRPKLVVHTLRSLVGAIRPGRAQEPVVWSTFYDIRRYGGLQIFLRAALTGTSLVLTSAGEATGEFLERAGRCGVTHISGTPSHWRRALMNPAAGEIKPRYVRLSGEIADGAVLEQLKLRYPGARVAHAFASTEAGVVLEVTDGEMGVPASALEAGASVGVEMKVEGGTLRVRSARTARCYLGAGSPRLKDADGFVDTGDVLELRDGRYYFAGRHDGTINVGGQKVHPEEVEAVINGYPGVSMSLVRTRKNPITGALVVADVVLKTAVGGAGRELQQEILAYCRGALARHKVPVAIQFVPALDVAETGKLVRRHG